jgi:type VI secretion system Hcp family effector
MRWRCFPRGRISPLLLLLVAATVSPARAATDYYVFINGIPGDSKATGRANWIESSGFGAVVQRGKNAARATMPPVFVAKRLDKASPLLSDATSRGTKIDEVVLETVNPATGQTGYKIVLKEVIIAAFRQEGSAGGDASLHESLTLDYARISWTYSGGTQPVSTHYDQTKQGGGTGPLPAATPIADSDSDGIPDDYEAANGLNPTMKDAIGDLDGDGATNHAEYVARTRANDARSVFRVRGVSRPDGTMLITWNSVAEKIYHVLASSRPEGPYSVVKPNILSAGNGETTATVNAAGTVLFYEVQTQ